MKELTTSYLANKVNGDLYGKDKVIKGIFNILKDAKKGDVVVRHWIDSSGVEIANNKDVSCIVTQNPLGNAISTAQDLDLAIIITEKIELTNAFAIQWTISKFAPESLRLVVTGTNGKSTTSHMIHHILNKAGYKSYTNTDSLSEFNTLIDPMVAKQIAESSGKEVLVLEVSEVQGWKDRIMKDHAFLMTQAINPDILVLTNVAMDHIGLVNSIEDAFHEIAGSLNGFKGKAVVLNQDDDFIMKMKDMVPPNAEIIFYGTGGDVEMKAEGIFVDGKLLLKKEELPFQSPHFIQNTLAAIAAAKALNIDKNIIKKVVPSYSALKRRFTVINKNPLIIDDFAHNPDGITATINSANLISKGKLYVVCAIRGSRGREINEINALALAKSLLNINYVLIVTSSQEVVDNANVVQHHEKKIFIDVLQKEGIQYTHYPLLNQALKEAIGKSGVEDTILLIGAQGMDPASDILEGFEEK
ncbi:MAG TPA: Mur ligase family protein [Methanobacteriaceae archaeon]|nr:Mur ligase family protein [Methanobacteriaceae archaeon]